MRGGRSRTLRSAHGLGPDRGRPGARARRVPGDPRGPGRDRRSWARRPTGVEAVDLARRRRARRGADGRPDARASTGSRRPGGSSAADAGAAVAVLMLTTFDLDEYVYDALRAGASGFLLKDVRPERAHRRGPRVAAGDALIAPAITRRLIERFAARRRRRAPRAGARRAHRPRARGARAGRARAARTPRSRGRSGWGRRRSRHTSGACWPSSARATASRPSCSPTRRAS